jgi:hypothetical protein
MSNVRRKQPWMTRGRAVIAAGKPGTIASLDEDDEPNGLVYWIFVDLDGIKEQGCFHPLDVKPKNADNEKR